jgi:hypothetical protein
MKFSSENVGPDEAEGGDTAPRRQGTTEPRHSKRERESVARDLTILLQDRSDDPTHAVPMLDAGMGPRWLILKAGRRVRLMKTLLP